MEEEKKEEVKEEVKVEKPKRSKKSKCITVMLVITLFCVISILLFVILGRDLLPFSQGSDNKQQEKQEEKKEEKKEEQKQEEEKNEEETEESDYKAVSAGTYKTKDGKFTLKIADTNDQTAKEDAKKRLVNYATFTQYAYINDKMLELFSSEEDENYLRVEGWLEGNEGSQFGYGFLISKKDGLIQELKPEGNDESRFNGENNSISFVKTKAGYFFIRGLSYEPYADYLYTTSWKELGYVIVDKIESDEQGVYVYSKLTQDLDIDKTSKVKFDVNGNKIG